MSAKCQKQTSTFSSVLASEVVVNALERKVVTLLSDVTRSAYSAIKIIPAITDVIGIPPSAGASP